MPVDLHYWGNISVTEKPRQILNLVCGSNEWYL